MGFLRRSVGGLRLRSNVDEGTVTIVVTAPAVSD
jgi:hypothetical protein